MSAYEYESQIYGLLQQLTYDDAIATADRISLLANIKMDVEDSIQELEDEENEAEEEENEEYMDDEHLDSTNELTGDLEDEFMDDDEE